MSKKSKKPFAVAICGKQVVASADGPGDLPALHALAAKHGAMVAVAPGPVKANNERRSMEQSLERNRAYNELKKRIAVARDAMVAGNFSQAGLAEADGLLAELNRLFGVSRSPQAQRAGVFGQMTKWPSEKQLSALHQKIAAFDAAFGVGHVSPNPGGARQRERVEKGAKRNPPDRHKIVEMRDWQSNHLEWTGRLDKFIAANANDDNLAPEEVAALNQLPVGGQLGIGFTIVTRIK